MSVTVLSHLLLGSFNLNPKQKHVAFFFVLVQFMLHWLFTNEPIGVNMKAYLLSGRLFTNQFLITAYEYIYLLWCSQGAHEKVIYYQHY